MLCNVNVMLMFINGCHQYKDSILLEGLLVKSAYIRNTNIYKRKKR